MQQASQWRVKLLYVITLVYKILNLTPLILAPITYMHYGLDVKSLLCYGTDYRQCEKMFVGLN
jgi:hypothetical protein